MNLMGRKSKLKKQRREQQKASESIQHLEGKEIKQEQKQKKKLSNLLQEFSRSSRENKIIANELGIEPVPVLILDDEFNSSVRLLEEANCGRFDLQEIIEVLNRVYGSGLMKSIAAHKKMLLYEYCSMLLSSWLDGIPRNILIPESQMFRISIDCHTFEVLPISILSTLKLRELFPEFIPEIEKGANIMMELVYTEEEAMFFAMHLHFPFSTSEDVYINRNALL